MIILHRKFPPGGVVGQFLRKCSSKDNDVEWANIPSGSSLPDGGTTGQALRKASNADQDVSWQNDPDPFPTGGSTGQVLTKTASGQAWQNVPTELPSGGTSGQILQKTSSGVGWRDAPREVPTGGASGYFLKKTGSGDNDYSWQYLNTNEPRYNSIFTDWSSYNLTTNSVQNFITNFYHGKDTYYSYYPYQICAYCFNNNVVLTMRIQVNGWTYMASPDIRKNGATYYVTFTSSAVSTGVIKMTINSSGVQVTT